MPLKPMTDDERRANADKSRTLRIRRAYIKRMLKDGFQPIVAWYMEPTRGMKVIDLLICLPGIGKARALSLLEQAGIPERNTVRACGPRQTERLFALLNK